ncbi:DNA methyltransferase [Paenibacillus enshidis]|uniref:DNA methyltransferase n=1 Tax=Paenibacillus enshidis TaxID=1458439 RepID=A0ABV5AYW0_9BACL
MHYRLFWNNYKYFPYEKEMAIKEVEALLNPQEIYSENDTLNIELDETDSLREKIKKLTYFSKVESDSETIIPSQARVEQTIGNSTNSRQATRYSAHGIHEYKGKFNPQVVKSLLNIFNVNENCNVIDPFSGSGTTLLECSLQNINAIGLDINPLAVFIANAKQTAISHSAYNIAEVGNKIIRDFHRGNKIFELPTNLTEREEYLFKWFPEEIFFEIEFLRKSINFNAGPLKNIFLVLLSNLIREYSLQEPADLRIRRRKSPFPEELLIDEYELSIDKFVNNMIYSQKITGLKVKKNKAINYDSRNLGVQEGGVLDLNYFDAGITSPPYATALPYIDTQRLSLVWLGLIPPNEIMPLEGNLIGSREFKKSIKTEWQEKMLNNASQIPESLFMFCNTLQNALSESDGFRRQAVPQLLYRYFADMMLMFKNLLPYFKKNAPYALIVGHNHTTLGGKRFDINTPKLLVEIAVSVGWIHDESVELQTYKRYGIHHKNAVNNETLIILRKP